MVKLCLQKALHSHGTGEKLHTVLCEIEAVVNDQLLTAISNSVDDYQTLTLSQLLLGCIVWME